MHIASWIISALIIIAAIALLCQFVNLLWHINREIKAGQNGIFRGLRRITQSLVSLVLFTMVEVLGVASINENGIPVTAQLLPDGWIIYLLLLMRLWLLATVASASLSLFVLRDALKTED